MEDAALKALMAEAAEEGASRALARVGLHDEYAGDDIRGLRDLLRSYRTVRSSMLSTFGKWLATTILLALAWFAGAKGWFSPS